MTAPSLHEQLADSCRQIIQAIPQVLWVARADGHVEYLSHRGREYFGNVPAEAYAWKWLDVVHPEDRLEASLDWAETTNSGECFERELRLHGASGEFRRFQLRAAPLPELPARWFVVGVELPEDDAKDEWRRSERRYRTLVRAGARIVWVVTLQKVPLAVYGAEEFFGRRDIPVSSAVWLEHIHPDDRERVEAAFDTSLKTEQPFHADYRLRRLDGKWRQVSARGMPVRDAAGRVEEWIGVVDDVTEEKELEEQVRQSQKMHAVGRLAGGIAHDFNNLLTIINGYSELVMANLPPGSPDRALLGEIRDAGERAAGLTRQLLSFSRKQVLEPKVLDLNEVVARTEKMLRRLIGEDVKFSTVLDPSLPRVRVDPSQIEQVLLNLAVNARDAMPQGGQLTIETKAVIVGQDALPGDMDGRPGYYAQLAVTDTGHGMTEEVKTQLFEPFFTTKELGKGTGLGLAVVHGIVKQSGGHIAVSSEVEAGTTFRLLFPAVDVAPARSSIHAFVTPKRGAETVLLVEDEEAVRRLAKLVLESHGYTVLTAGNGREAIRVAGQHTGPIHLLLTDVVMPEMGGRELAEYLRPRISGLRVLHMSGYTDNATARRVAVESPFLQKPFTPLSLAKKVREVLDAGS